MGFKAQVAIDNDSVFLDDSEFAAIHNINGQPVTAIIQGVTDSEHTAEGAYLSEFDINAKSIDLPTLVIDQRLSVNGQQAVVQGIDEGEGMLTIRCRWYES